MKSLKRQKTHSELLDEKANQPYTLASCSIIVTCHELNLTTLGVVQPEHPSIPSAQHVLGYDGLNEVEAGAKTGHKKMETQEVLHKAIERG
jgi:hypothetical protein